MNPCQIKSLLCCFDTTVLRSSGVKPAGMRTSWRVTPPPSSPCERHIISEQGGLHRFSRPASSSLLSCRRTKELSVKRTNYHARPKAPGPSVIPHLHPGHGYAQVDPPQPRPSERLGSSSVLLPGKINTHTNQNIDHRLREETPPHSVQKVEPKKAPSVSDTCSLQPAVDRLNAGALLDGSRSVIRR